MMPIYKHEETVKIYVYIYMLRPLRIFVKKKEGLSSISAIWSIMI